MNRTKLSVGVVAGLVVLLALGGWLWSRRTSDATSGGQLKVQVAGDHKGPLALDGLKVNEKGELSEADQQKLMQRAASHRTQMVEEYFKLTPGKERKAYLDKLIDQQEEARKMMEADGKPTTQPGVAVKTENGSTTQPTRVTIKAKMDPKTATESIPPGDRARMAEMMADLAARRAERGLPAMNGIVMVRKEVK